MNTESSSATPNSIDELIGLWDSTESIDTLGAQRFVELGRSALEFGHPSLAFDILNRGLGAHAGNAQMTYCAALALARAGSYRSASELLNPLLCSLSESDALHGEAMSLAGRLAKDCYQKLSNPVARQQAARDSAQRYRSAFAASGDYFPGINAATMTMLGGDTAEARALAESVLASISTPARGSAVDDYWLTATLGEANLLLGRGEEAARWYATATRGAGERVGDIASMRRQVRLLSEAMDVDAAVLQALDIPKVIAFAGHMLDRPEQVVSRFPAAAEQRVRTAIREALDRYGAEFGYTSAACGADILFIEEMLDRGGEVHIALPFRRDDFVETSVAFAGTDWVTRFHRVLERATAVSFATNEGYLGDDVLFQYTGDLINGMALLRAEQLATDPVLLAVLEPQAIEKKGGTADQVRRWREQGKSTEVIDIARIRRELDVPGSPSQPAPHNGAEPQAVTRETGREVRSMLFADVVGFSKLREEAAPSFFVEFLGQVANVISRSDPRPASCNTWGDGLFIVFDSVTAAADFSLRLRDMVVANDWGSVGLPNDTNIRIAVHAGPVYRAFDPIIEKQNYFGAHVNRAARIEPVTTPGSVFVSEQTACLLAAQGQSDFACDYLGVMSLAKKYGSGALYRLRRTNEIE